VSEPFAVAVLLDVTLIHMLTVPATMELLRARNWWMPRWLDRIVPRISVEGTPQRRDASARDEPDEPVPGPTPTHKPQPVDV
jgi:putative drug exporter of the RND superfamily